MKCNDLPVETQSLYSTLSDSNRKLKKVAKSNSSSDSSCSDSDPEFEYVLVKRKPKQQYSYNQRGGRIVTMKLHRRNHNQKVINLKR